MRQLAQALAFVHGRALVHRDIKPGNVLLADTGQIKLGNFGLARMLTAEHRLTTNADVMGTSAYLSPEQARGVQVGPASDIYLLGLVLLECLTGHREFPGEPVQAALARLLRHPMIPPQLPFPWPGMLSAVTDAVPDRRPTADQIAAALTDATSNARQPTLEPTAAAAYPARLIDQTGQAQTPARSGPLSPF